MKKNLEATIEEIVTKITDEHGFEMVDVEYVKEGAEWYLRLYIDKENGAVELDDCENMSRTIGDLLDKKDPIEQAYRLEVSSPGIERPLKRMKDFVRFKGEKVRVRTFSPIDGTKEFVGVLGEVDDNDLILMLDAVQKILPRDKISRVNLVWEF